jgi:exosortase D (VPLPA-CTERM-specific)
MQTVRPASPLQVYSLLAVAIAAAVVPFARVLASLYSIWNIKPEYSHGIIIPVLSAYLIWRQREELRRLPFTGSWAGLVLIAVGLALRFLGELTTMQTLEHYAFLLVLYGVILALTGPAVFRRLWMPLLILVFAIPLPSFFNNSLSLQLQLLSSTLGVWFIRAAGISVLLEGNVIDLGSYQLEVAEACSGLRYLFPLMTLAFIVAYLFRGPMWKRVALFLSSIPITVVMNSLRIGLIGITVDRWGSSMAEGPLHDFEGWLMFMVSTAALILTAMGLSRVGRSRVSWREAFDVGLEPSRPTAARNGGSTASSAADASAMIRSIPRSFIAAAVLVLVGACLAIMAPASQLYAPTRTGFEEFPSRIGAWTGHRDVLQPVYLDKLRLDDYVLSDYSDGQGAPVNFYAAYYRTQDSTREVHSPHDCIPGGGWQIQNMQRRTFPAVGTSAPFPMNRAVIALGSTRQIVYYWFQERDRRLTNEYVVRWYLFWDALTRHRTDGALVRFVAAYPAGANESEVDARIMQLATQVVPKLSRYIPD